MNKIKRKINEQEDKRGDLYRLLTAESQLPNSNVVE